MSTSILLETEERIEKGELVVINPETKKVRRARFGDCLIEIDPNLRPNEWRLIFYKDAR